MVDYCSCTLRCFSIIDLYFVYVAIWKCKLDFFIRAYHWKRYFAISFKLCKSFFIQNTTIKHKNMNIIETCTVKYDFVDRKCLIHQICHKVFQISNKAFTSPSMFGLCCVFLFLYIHSLVVIMVILSLGLQNRKNVSMKPFSNVLINFLKLILSFAHKYTLRYAFLCDPILRLYSI